MNGTKVINSIKMEFWVSLYHSSWKTEPKVSRVETIFIPNSPRLIKESHFSKPLQIASNTIFISDYEWNQWHNMEIEKTIIMSQQLQKNVSFTLLQTNVYSESENYKE